MKENFGLYLILTNPVAGYETCAKAAVEAGIRYLQLRMKNTPRNKVIEMGNRIKTLTTGTDTRFIMNDSLEAAMACNADGIHLGQSDLNLSDARKTWGKADKIYGLSTHSIQEAFRAVELSPDYIGIGPVFPTQTKLDTDPVVGALEAGRIAREIPITSVAIGGVTAENLPQVLQTGATNFCVISAVNQASDPLKAIHGLQDVWKSYAF